MNKTTKICAIGGLSAVAAAAVAYGVFFGAKPEAQANNFPANSSAGIIAQTDNASADPSEVIARANSSHTEILLSDSGISVNGNGASVSENTVTISKGGTYSISGTVSQGQIYVNAGGNDPVVLSLNGADISNPSGAAVHVENAGNTLILLENGTTNRLQSGVPVEISSTGDSNASGGAVYAKDDIGITGTGSLQVFGYINNGLQSSNNITIESGNIEVTALNNGIKGKDSVIISGGEISVRSGGDGIKSDDTTGDGYGVIKISGGKISIDADSDGIQAETDLEISGGEFSITAGGGSESVTYKSDMGMGGRGGWNWQNRAENSDMDDSSDVSTKGIKCGGNIRLSGGSISVDSLDDAVHSNDSISVTGGEFALASGDDGIHADKELSVESGTIRVTRSYEGLEGNIIRLSGGSVDITAADDGINAYGGQNNFGGFGGGSSKITGETPMLYFSGADVVIDANGDGIDSNGSIFVEAGTIIVNGPTNSGNGAIDSGSENGGKCVITGGTILAVGSAGMDEGFSSESSQCSFRQRLGNAVSSGSEIIISDTAGNVLFRHTVSKTASSVVFSSPDLKIGEKYILSAGGQEYEIEQSSVSVGESGGFGGNFGGGFGRNGGGRFRGNPNDDSGENPGGNFGNFPNGDGDENFGGGFGRISGGEGDGNFRGGFGNFPNGDGDGNFRGGFGKFPDGDGNEDFRGILGTPPDGMPTENA